jgi:Flp pilus assembly protein TadB
MNNSQNNQAQQLWQSQPTEGIKMSAEAIRQRAGKFERTISHRNVREYVASLLAAMAFAYFLVTAHDVLFRIAYVLFIAGLALVVFQLHRKGSAKTLPSALGNSTSLQFFRTELERQRDVIKNVWPWYLAPLVPGFVVLTIGSAMARPFPVGLASAAFLDVVVAALFYGIWKMNVRAARSLQRTIDELQAAENH